MSAERARTHVEGRIAVAEAPFIYGSPTGKRYRALATPKALARGAPAEQCFGVGLASGPNAPAEALRRCLADMADEPRARACGCRLLAMDDILLAERAAFAYAPGVSGRLLGAAAPPAGNLVVAEASSPQADAALVAFFGLDGGPLAIAEIDASGSAALIMPNAEAPFVGTRERWGWRRGRLTERLLLTDPEGRRLIALIGFEPKDIAAEGASLGNWTKG